ncbi:MAG TPA: DNA-formamidopyrimidine glycosylase family protein [Acidobacteriota bacterium]|nr:DNA-formamidopyrimidine glycosylase family protein [Acidobacteriota bacterium]
MPELPDVELYFHALGPRVLDKTLQATRLKSIFLLRSVRPPISETSGRKIMSLDRLRKHIVFGLEGDRGTRNQADGEYQAHAQESR